MRIHGVVCLKDKRNQRQVTNQAEEQEGDEGDGLGFLLEKGGEEDAQKGADLDNPEQVSDREDQGNEGHVEKVA